MRSGCLTEVQSDAGFVLFGFIRIAAFYSLVCVFTTKWNRGKQIEGWRKGKDLDCRDNPKVSLAA